MRRHNGNGETWHRVATACKEEDGNYGCHLVPTIFFISKTFKDDRQFPALLRTLAFYICNLTADATIGKRNGWRNGCSFASFRLRRLRKRSKIAVLHFFTIFYKLNASHAFWKRRREYCFQHISRQRLRRPYVEERLR